MESGARESAVQGAQGGFCRCSGLKPRACTLFQVWRAKRALRDKGSASSFLAMIQASDIEQMSLEQQLQTMELLWASISRTPDEVPSADWHEEVLNSRRAKIERGEAEFLTLAQVKERLQKPPA